MSDDHFMATPHKTPEIAFIDRNDKEISAYYEMIGMIERDLNNTVIRVSLSDAVVNIVSNNAKQLRRMIYSRRYPEIEERKTYDGVEIKEIRFFDPKNLPPIPDR